MKIGFIGAGNMGGAIIGGLVASGKTDANDIYAYDLDKEKLNILGDKGVNVNLSTDEICEICDVVILAVKPQIFPKVLPNIKNNKPVYVSIAAGISIKFMKDNLPDNSKIVRAMPNTPALIGKGVTVLSPDKGVTEEQVANVKFIFDCVGITEIADEKLMDAVVSASGSSPAYVYMLIEAMADAAVSQGLPRQMAYNICAAAVEGSALMVQKTGKHPGELKDMVCSPGGTTIEAVSSLEADGFRASIINAMAKCAEKSKKLTK
ncbi:MAG: pyrroline-5-carboxylate reductase [Clostridia bacterium]|nr:pyrroline-5-carboxylate reductase [Clostridia bacterium]